MRFSRSAPAHRRGVSWDEARLPVWLRLLLFAAVGYAAVVCVGWVAERYQDVMASGTRAFVLPARPSATTV